MMRSLRVLATLVVAWLIAPSSIALAHGGGAPRLTNAPAGPYRVYAWSDPEPWRVGEVHLSLAVTQPASDAEAAPGAMLEVPVSDAEITVTLTPVAGGAPIRLIAAPQAMFGDFYFEADTILPADGLWDVTVEINGPQGSGSSSFQIEALPPPTLNWTLVGAGIGTLVLMAALAGVMSRRGASNAEARPRRTRRTAETARHA